MQIEAIVCIDEGNGLSRPGGVLPWAGTPEGKSDMQFVRQKTLMVAPGKKNILIVGHNTFKTLPEAFIKVTSVRETYLLSASAEAEAASASASASASAFASASATFSCARALYAALLDRYYTQGDVDHVFVFGGGQIYQYFLAQRWIHTFYVTQIHRTYDGCDVFFPMALLVEAYVAKNIAKEKNSTLTVWVRKPHPEYAYLDLLQKTYYTGQVRPTRNDSDTRSCFGAALEFDVAQFGFPLLTTKKMFFKGIAEELCWFLKGDTDATHLQQKSVRIWDGNTSRAALDQRGLTEYAEGIAGPIYGFQWRHFNAPYSYSCEKKEVKVKEEKKEEKEKQDLPFETKRDQLFACLKLLREDPHSRRILFCGWNPLQLDEMCLPPCHVLYQFYVSNNVLSCQMYQRSGDLFLGLPFNIASTALLTHVFAHLAGLTVGTVRITLGDAHIYAAHTECVRQQLLRAPQPFCRLDMKKKNKLEDFDATDFTLQNYTSHGPLKAPMLA
jgi:thymidylate synthase